MVLNLCIVINISRSIKIKKGNWVYIYDEDRGDKNQTGIITSTNVSTGKTTTVGYTYNKNIDDRNEKEYKTTTKIANAVKNIVKPVTDKVSEVTGLSARKKIYRPN
jgi:Ethanolamine utilization protein EutJ (predicted chaperonin)